MVSSNPPLQQSGGLEKEVKERKWRNLGEQENRVSNFGRFGFHNLLK